MRRNTADTRNEMMPGTLEMLVLKALTRGPMHGYGIAQSIKQASDEVLTVEEGSLYPALQRMKVKGWITSEWGISENNRRARFYSITEEGRGRLEREISLFDEMVSAIRRVLQET